MMTEAPVQPAELALEPQYAAELALVQERMGSDFWRKIDQVDEDLEQCEPAAMPLNHVLTPGLYMRSIFMKKGTILTTRIHLTEHPFVISMGVVTVISDEGWETLRGVHIGVTMPGTRRVLVVHEDCIWTTSHTRSDSEIDPNEIVRRITYSEGKFKRLGAAEDFSIRRLQT